MTKSTKAISSLSFEQALQELETIVRKLESGDGALEDSIQDFTRGNALKEHCAKKLADAKLKVEKLNINTDGEATSAAPYAAAQE